MQRYKHLKVWQRSHAFVLAVYKLTAQYPTDERFGPSTLDEASNLLQFTSSLG